MLVVAHQKKKIDDNGNRTYSRFVNVLVRQEVRGLDREDTITVKRRCLRWPK